MKVSSILASAFAAVLLVTRSQEASAQNIVDVATSNGLTTLLNLVVAADLAGALTDGSTDLTVLAPTNAAFAALPNVLVESITKAWNKDILQSILLYHVFGAKIESPVVAGLANSKSNTPATLQGNRIAVSNCPGSGICLNKDSKIVAVDVPFTNAPRSGVVHVIDKVLVPKGVALPTNTIVGVVSNMNKNGNFKLLFRALSLFPAYVDALNTMSADGYTVFAPTDKAFRRALPKRCCRNVARCRALLERLLPYHVVPVAAKAADLTDGQELPTLVPGNTLEVDINANNKVRIDGANVINANIRASNGVIHAIDAVLIPNA